MLAANFFLAIVFSWLQWMWAVAAPRADPARPLRRRTRWPTVGGISAPCILSGIVLVLSPFIGSIAFTVFLLDGFLTRRLRGKGD